MGDFSVCLPFPRTGQEQNNWDQVLSHWVPETIYLLGTGELPRVNNIFRDAVQIDLVCEVPADHAIVGLSPPRGRALPGLEPLGPFVHPERVVYVFGANNEHMDRGMFGAKDPDHMVYIPTETHFEMYSWMAAGVTLYDRAAKMDQNG